MIPKFRIFIPYKGLVGGMYEVTTIYFQDRAISAKNDHHNIYVEFDRCEIMQSTGLYDQNGTEIFEGDILKAENDDLETFYAFYFDGRKIAEVRLRENKNEF